MSAWLDQKLEARGLEKADLFICLLYTSRCVRDSSYPTVDGQTITVTATLKGLTEALSPVK